MEKAYVGIDMAKDKFDACLRLEQEQWFGQFINSTSGHRSFLAWIKKRVKQAGVHAGMESTGRYGDELAKLLYNKGCEVSVINPSRIKHYARSKLQRNKTDKLDAALITDFVSTQSPHLWQPPTEAEETLHQLVQRLQSLIENQTQEKNRLKEGNLTPFVQQSLTAHLDFLETQIKSLEEQIASHIDNHPHLRDQQALLESIPGIGSRTAAILLALLPAIERGLSSKQVAAFAGLTPEQLQSGNYRRRSDVLSKLGKSNLRAALYMPALSAMRFNPILFAFADRLRQRGKKPMSIVAAVMRKLLVLAYGVLKSGVSFDPNYAGSIVVPTTI